MPKRMTWDEMVKEYPDQWVVMTDVKFADKHRANIESATVLQVLPDEEASNARLHTDRQGLPYLYRRITPYAGYMGVGIW